MCVGLHTSFVRLTSFTVCAHPFPSSLPWVPWGGVGWSSSCHLAAGREHQENSVLTHFEKLNKLWNLLPLDLHETFKWFHCFNLIFYYIRRYTKGSCNYQFHLFSFFLSSNFSQVLAQGWDGMRLEDFSNSTQPSPGAQSMGLHFSTSGSFLPPPVAASVSLSLSEQSDKPCLDSSEFRKQKTVGIRNTFQKNSYNFWLVCVIKEWQEVNIIATSHWLVSNLPSLWEVLVL